MDYNNEHENVYNVDERDVQDLEEFSEPVEEVNATVENINHKDSYIETQGIVYSIITLVSGLITFSSVFWENLSFILSLLLSGVSVYFSLKYLFGGYHHKVFGKFAIIGFLLALFGVILLSIRLVLISISSFGQAFLVALF